MTRLATLDQHLGAVITGQYTLTRVESRATQLGDRFKAIHLADCSGSLHAYAWENTGILDRIPRQIPATIQADLYVRRFHDDIIANLKAIHLLEPHEVENAATLLPAETCPVIARPALAKLADFVGALEPAVLRAFLNRVLLDPRVSDSLTTCKGSQTHHHRQVGGLLVHSIEVMEIAGNMAGSQLNPVERAITQVAALLHDLGKLRTVGSGVVRPVHYLVTSHEAQTGRILDPHLEWLRARAPDIATGLDYTLDFLARPAAVRGQARFLAPDLIHAADQMSAALDNHRRLDDLLTRTLPQRSVRRHGARRPARHTPAIAWL